MCMDVRVGEKMTKIRHKTFKGTVHGAGAISFECSYTSANLFSFFGYFLNRRSKGTKFRQKFKTRM